MNAPENTPKSESFEGEVVIVCREEEGSPTHYIDCGILDRQRGTLVDCGRIFVNMAMRERLKTSNAPQLIQRAAQNTFRKRLAALRRHCSAELVEILAEGRLKILLLINSAGGIKSIADAIIHTIDLINRTRGTSISYVDFQALSAGGLIFLAAEKRYMTEYAKILLHGARAPAGFPDHADEDPDSPLSRANIQRDDLIQAMELLRKAAVPEAQKKIDTLERRLQQQGNWEVELQARILEKLGIAKLVQNPYWLREQFKQDIEYPPVFELPEVKRFFS